MPREIDRAISVHVIPQREDRDCAVAVLAMLTGVSYEDALRVVCEIDDEGASDGLYLTQLMEASSSLGVPLRRKRRFKLDTASGVLYLVSKREDWIRHVVLMRRGVVIDTNARIWLDPMQYCRHYRYTPRALLVELE